MSAQANADQPLVSVIDTVRGIPIHARVSVPAIADASMPLVFVHGLGVSVRYMEPTMSRLGRAHHVAGLDLPGFGRSGNPPHVLDLEELSTALADWLDVRRIGPAIFVGNSYGCQVIVDLVFREPSRAIGLVLNAPTMDPVRRSLFGVGIRVLADVAFEPWALAAVVGRDYLRAGPRRIFTTLQYALDDQIEAKLAHLVAPTVVVAGARDPVVSVEWAREAARLVGISTRSAPGATLHVLPNGAHALPFDDAANFATLIDAFVERVRASRQPR
ncbi:MAG: alpha/beta hydrolase [bacterium]